MNKKNFKLAFTMAEILLSLTIIGVVAAITLPSLTGNINERTWNTQRKALYSRLSQAIAVMGNINGYGQYVGTLNSNYNVSVSVDTAGIGFVTGGLSKVLKINNICDSDHLEDCGLPSKIYTVRNTKKNFPTKRGNLNPYLLSTTWGRVNGIAMEIPNPARNVNTKAVGFTTVNGESIAVFYNPYCTGNNVQIDEYYFMSGTVCAVFLYDLNGKKGPNTIGKDLGIITAFYPTDSVVVMPIPIYIDSTTRTHEEATKMCNNIDDARLPNVEELVALSVVDDYVNVGIGSSQDVWSSKKASENNFIAVNYYGFSSSPSPENQAKLSICVKRY